jgi:hypothetical protein
MALVTALQPRIYYVTSPHSEDQWEPPQKIIDESVQACGRKYAIARQKNPDCVFTYVYQEDMHARIPEAIEHFAKTELPGWFVCVMYAPVTLADGIHRAYANSMRDLVRAGVASDATILQIQLKEWFDNHLAGHTLRTSDVLVKTIWESHFENSHLELSKEDRRNQWLILSHDYNCDKKRNTITTRKYSLQSNLEKHGYTDFTTNVHTISSFAVCQAGCAHLFLSIPVLYYLFTYYPQSHSGFAKHVGGLKPCSDTSAMVESLLAGQFPGDPASFESFFLYDLDLGI